MKQKSNVVFALALAFSLAALLGSCANEAGTGEPEQNETNESSQPSQPVETPSIEPAPHENPSNPGKTPPAEEAPHETENPAPPAPTGSTPSATVQEAMNQLETLPVKGRAPKTGYARSQFGKRWKDIDHNGCDTRNDILNRDLSAKTYRPGTHDCVVLTGTLQEPYTGTQVSFDKKKAASAVQIDHVVALSDAWQKGAQQLTAEQREQLANDPLNLLAVDGRENQRKSDGDAATWLPPNKAFRCRYVSLQVNVKTKYHLWVTSAEKDAMARVLSKCSGAVGWQNSTPATQVGAGNRLTRNFSG
ncbi:HNH endonuclease family protein [Mobiluncus mulieris]|uniref:DUF1524 domain-containing protein n=1 Tax=Mobiluncus mulieris TaxID=2052 RepID=A0A7Y0UTF6_9ACTO|nr:HNH endonuclease family protein [Mobiluncus mulieris]NMX03421.1 DUF1524 domain-containing protein [Mobiluncus mulieris]